MEEWFAGITKHIALALEAISVILIAIGGMDASWRLLNPGNAGKETQGVRRDAWLSFGRWLLLGLEFTLAADIVKSAISPSWDAIGKLAAIALIRTFLSYFLERDLKEAQLTQE